MLIRYVSLVRQVWLEDMVRVRFYMMKKIIVGQVKQVDDGQDVVAVEGLLEPFIPSQQKIKTRWVGSRTPSRP